jgi:hypothetical protein
MMVDCSNEFLDTQCPRVLFNLVNFQRSDDLLCHISQAEGTVGCQTVSGWESLQKLVELTHQKVQCGPDDSPILAETQNGRTVTSPSQPL